MSIAPVQTTPPDSAQAAHKSRGGGKSKAAQTNRLTQKNNGAPTQPRAATSVFAKQLASPLMQKQNINAPAVPKASGRKASGYGEATKSPQQPAKPKDNGSWNTSGSIVDLYV